MEKLKIIYDNAVNAVCEASELDLKRLFTSHEEEYVDARAILVDCLIRAGFTERMICRYSKMSQQRINSLKNGFIRRKQKMSVALCLEEVDRRLIDLTQKSNN